MDKYRLTEYGYNNLSKELVKLLIEKKAIEARENEIIDILDNANIIDGKVVTDGN